MPIFECCFIGGELLINALHLIKTKSHDFLKLVLIWNILDENICEFILADFFQNIDTGTFKA